MDVLTDFLETFLDRLGIYLAPDQIRKTANDTLDSIEKSFEGQPQRMDSIIVLGAIRNLIRKPIEEIPKKDSKAFAKEVLGLNPKKGP